MHRVRRLWNSATTAAKDLTANKWHFSSVDEEALEAGQIVGTGFE